MMSLTFPCSRIEPSCLVTLTRCQENLIFILLFNKKSIAIHEYSGNDDSLTILRISQALCCSPIYITMNTTTIIKSVTIINSMTIISTIINIMTDSILRFRTILTCFSSVGHYVAPSWQLQLDLVARYMAVLNSR